MTLAFRSATADDAQRLAEQSVLAYPTTDVSTAQRVESYLRGSVSAIETFTLAERDGVLVGAMRTIPYTGFVGGVATPIGGLASVAVAPEARLTGVAGQLVRRHLGDLSSAGTPWSFLYPFSPKFYAHYGWAAAARRLRWRLRPETLPLLPERARVRRLRLADKGDDDRTAMQGVYERMLPRTNGSLTRSVEQLGWAFEGNHAVGVDGPDGLSGYLVYSTLAPTPRPQSLVVREWLAEDVATERALFGFLGAQRDQVAEVVIDTTEDHPLGALIENGAPAVEDDSLPGEHHMLASLSSGLMARIVDLPRAVAQRGYPGVASGAVALTVTADPVVSGNITTVTARIEDGRAQAVSGAPAKEAVVAGAIGPLSAILVGALRVDAAVRLGLVDVKGDIARATALLELPPLSPLIVF
jgi:predicted acetyltransferase